MANALPLLLAGGAALILLGGKKKRGKSKLRRGCTPIETVAALLNLDRAAAANYPMALIVYPASERSKAEARCKEYGDGGWSAVMVSTETIESAGEIVLPGEYLATDANREPAFVNWDTATQNLGA